MRHDDRYREHRVRTSLTRFVGDKPMDEGAIRAQASAMFHDTGSVMFLAADLAKMPWDVRAYIDGQAAKIYGPKVKR